MVPVKDVWELFKPSRALGWAEHGREAHVARRARPSR
jgi:hypothetical protein